MSQIKGKKTSAGALTTPQEKVHMQMAVRRVGQDPDHRSPAERKGKTRTKCSSQEGLPGVGLNMLAFRTIGRI